MGRRRFFAYRHDDAAGHRPPFQNLAPKMGDDFGYPGFLRDSADKGKAPAGLQIFKTQPYVFKTGSAVLPIIDSYRMLEWVMNLFHLCCVTKFS